MNSTANTGTSRAGVGRYRRHTAGGRHRQIRLRYTDHEYAIVEQAAHAAGLTPTGYVAETALAAATGIDPPSNQPWRQALLELIDARNQVRRIGINVNQAARDLNATGEAPIWLHKALRITCRSLAQIDQAADAVAVLARSASAGTPRFSPAQSEPTARPELTVSGA